MFDQSGLENTFVVFGLPTQTQFMCTSQADQTLA